MTKIAQDPDLLQLGLSSSENDPAPKSGVADSSGLIHQLAKLIGREMADARRLVGDGAWLENVMEWRS